MVTSRQAKRLEAQRKIIQHFEEKIPYFTDIFDERTFYISFACLCVVCVILAIVLSVCCKVTIRDADEIAREREERKRLKQRKLIEKLIKKRMAKAGMNPDGVNLRNSQNLRNILLKLNENKAFLNESDLENFDKNLNEDSWFFYAFYAF